MPVYNFNNGITNGMYTGVYPTNGQSWGYNNGNLSSQTMMVNGVAYQRNVFNIGGNCGGDNNCIEGYSLYFPCIKNITRGQSTCFEFYIGDNANQDELDMRDLDSLTLDLSGRFGCPYKSYTYPDDIDSLQEEKYKEVLNEDFNGIDQDNICVLTMDYYNVNMIDEVNPNITGKIGSFHIGDHVKLVADDTPTHIFVGWGVGEEIPDEKCENFTIDKSIKSTEKIYEFNIEKDTYIVALYRYRKIYNVRIAFENRNSHFEIISDNGEKYYLTDKERDIVPVTEGYPFIATCLPYEKYLKIDNKTDWKFGEIENFYYKEGGEYKIDDDTIVIPIFKPDDAIQPDMQIPIKNKSIKLNNNIIEIPTLVNGHFGFPVRDNDPTRKYQNYITVDRMDEDIYFNEVTFITQEGFEIVVSGDVMIPKKGSNLNSEINYDMFNKPYTFVKWDDGHIYQSRELFARDDNPFFRDGEIKLMAKCIEYNPNIPNIINPVEKTNINFGYNLPEENILSEEEFSYYPYETNDDIIEIENAQLAFKVGKGYLHIKDGYLKTNFMDIVDGIKIKINVSAITESVFTFEVDGESMPYNIEAGYTGEYECLLRHCNNSDVKISVEGEMLIDDLVIYEEVIENKGLAQLCLSSEDTAEMHSGPLNVSGAISANGEVYGLNQTLMGNINNLKTINLV